MFFRSTLIAIAATLAVATPASAAQVTAQASVNVVKPVTLTKLTDLNFGTVTFNTGTGSVVVAISQAGVVSCPAGVVCTGATSAAGFNVQGTNKMTALITVTPGSLSNGTDSIAFTPNAPSSVYLPNSGSPGIDFGVGGSISIGANNGGGTYTGTIGVTAEYQ